MTVRIDQISPAVGLATGDDVVTIRGELPERIGVWFGTARARVEGGFLDSSSGIPVSVVQVRTPRVAPGRVDVTVRELDASGEPIPGEQAMAPAAFRFERVRLGVESDLTRLVRTLIRELKRQVLENTSLAVSVEYPEDPDAVLARVAESKLPSLVLSGPRLRENRAYATNDPGEEVVIGIAGPELRRRRPPRTMDLEFGVTIASDRAAEMLNLQAALVRFVHANAWLSMPRDSAHPSGPLVGWELDPLGDLRPLVEGTERSDVRAFSWGIVIRGFDLAEDQVLDVHRQVARAGEVELEPLEGSG